MAEPVVTMTPLQYWRRWLIVGVVALLLARLVLINPILSRLDALLAR